MPHDPGDVPGPLKNVSIRTLGGRPPGWSVPVTEYLLVYFAMFAAPYVLRLRGHVFVEMMVDRLPEAGKAWFGRLVALICSLAAGLLTVYSAILMIEAIESGELDLRAIDIPIWLLYLPLPIGFAFLAAEFAIFALGRDGLYAANVDAPH